MRPPPRSQGVLPRLLATVAVATLVSTVPAVPAIGAPTRHADGVATTPDIAAFIPANYRVTGVSKVDLDGASTDEEAITAVGTLGSDGVVPTTVVLIAWDRFVQRWTAVFNAAQQASYQTGLQTGQKGPGLILPTGAGPTVALMRDLPGKTASLVYWVQAVGGNTTVWLIGIVNFQNQMADLAWTGEAYLYHIYSYGVKPRVFLPPPLLTGRSPHQELLVTAPWQTPDDNESYAVRQYSYRIARAQSQGFEGYETVDDTRSFVGVELATLPPKAPPKVVYVYPGSPAHGVLHVGDLITGVVGAPPPPEAKWLNGPAVLDQVALFYPGQQVRLELVRAGLDMTVGVTLGRWPSDVEELVQQDEHLFESM